MLRHAQLVGGFRDGAEGVRGPSPRGTCLRRLQGAVDPRLHDLGGAEADHPARARSRPARRSWDYGPCARAWPGPGRRRIPTASRFRRVSRASADQVQRALDKAAAILAGQTPLPRERPRSGPPASTSRPSCRPRLRTKPFRDE